VATIAAGNKLPFYASQRSILSFLARLDEEKLHIAETAAAPDNVLTIALGDVTCYLPLAGMVDANLERTRLSKELARVSQEIDRVTNLLSSPFAHKAPPPVVQKERDKLALLKASKTEIEGRLAAL
jgi:valyl-tRNA synthetase